MGCHDDSRGLEEKIGYDDVWRLTDTLAHASYDAATMLHTPE
jgi:hypothetical protein